ncbi:MAG: SAM-dependent methyltransferase [Bacteroidota bacterium]
MITITVKLLKKRFLIRSASLKLLFTGLAMTLIFSGWISLRAEAQDLDVPYVPTSTKVVNKMLDVADVGPGDYVIDLGSGDGRIVIAAAQQGAYGHGVDIDPERIREAEENAIKAGVSDRVMFLQEDVFDTDFRRANVITMYLLSSVNMKLRSRLLDSLKPGTRVVSHDFDMEDWEPDKHLSVDEDDVYFWVIPAKIEGQWIWHVNGKRLKVTARQKFQEVNLKIKSGDDALMIEENDQVLVGERIGFTAVNLANGHRHVYSGRVDGDTITGKVQIHGNTNSGVENWSATIRRNP